MPIEMIALVKTRLLDDVVASRRKDRSIDLQNADGKLRQITQRRIASAKVVYRNKNAHFLEFQQVRAHPLVTDKQQTFGDLELQPCRLAFRFGEGTPHGSNYVDEIELAR